LIDALRAKLVGRDHLEMIFEPGRIMVADAGILVTQVEYIKHHEENHFAIVNAGMNDLVRPALYDAWMRIIPVLQPNSQMPSFTYDIVGPVCESSDCLGKKRDLAIKQGDLLAVCEAGAYGFSMASHYNSRPRVAEVLVDEENHYLIRKRETYADLWRGEYLIEKTNA
jgi:diaminopimelate decarboxylase